MIRTANVTFREDSCVLLDRNARPRGLRDTAGGFPPTQPAPCSQGPQDNTCSFLRRDDGGNRTGRKEARGKPPRYHGGGTKARCFAPARFSEQFSQNMSQGRRILQKSYAAFCRGSKGPATTSRHLGFMGTRQAYLRGTFPGHLWTFRY